MASIIPIEKSGISLIVTLWWLLSRFPLSSLVFNSLTVVCLVFFFNPGNNVMQLLNLWVYFHCSLLESSWPSSLQIFLLLLSYFFQYFSYVFVTPFEVVPLLLDVLFYCFILFSLCISVWEVSIDLFSSGLRILSSCMSSLLVNPSKAFFVSFTVFETYSLSLRFLSLYLHFPFEFPCCLL